MTPIQARDDVLANQSADKLPLQSKETPHDTLPLQYPNQMHADYPHDSYIEV